jgi:hypothetical protein
MKSKFFNPYNPLSILSLWKDLKRSNPKYAWQAYKKDFESAPTFWVSTRTDQGDFVKLTWTESKSVFKELSYEKIKTCLYELYLAQTTSLRMIRSLIPDIPLSMIKPESNDWSYAIREKQFTGASIYPFFPLQIHICQRPIIQKSSSTWPFQNMCYETNNPCNQCKTWHKAAKEWMTTHSWAYWSGDSLIKPWDLSLHPHQVLAPKVLSAKDLDYLTNIPESKQVLSLGKPKAQAKKPSKKVKDPEPQEEEEENSSEEDDDEELILDEDNEEGEEEGQEEDEDLELAPTGNIIPSEDALVELKAQTLEEDDEEAEILSDHDSDGGYFEDDD